jgi:hypothetical protein
MEAAMSEFIPGGESTTTLPFSQAVLEAEAKNATEHPENKDTPFSQTDVGKLILETEQKNVADFQAGKISQEEFDHLREVSQQHLDTIKEHVGEDLQDLTQRVNDWKQDTVDQFKDLKEAHPEVIADLEHGNPTVVNATVAADLAINVIEPLIVDVALEGVHQLGDHLMDDLKDAAVDIVGARSELSSVTEEERDSNHARVDAVVTKLDEDQEKFDRSIEVAEDKVHHDMDQAHQAIEAAHDYGEAHPDAHVLDHAQTADTPEVQQELSAHEGSA